MLCAIDEKHDCLELCTPSIKLAGPQGNGCAVCGRLDSNLVLLFRGNEFP